MNYTLKHKNRNIAIFSIQTKSVDQCIINKHTISELPLPLKRLVKEGYKEEFVDFETDDYFCLNEDGCFLFDNWIADRQIPINRFNYQHYIAGDKTARQWLFENNGYSFDDAYWFESEEEQLTWNDIKQRIENLDVYIAVQDEHHRYKGQNNTLGGQLEKFWYRLNDKIMLCKKHPVNYDVLAAREVIASLIYQKQGYPNYCSYTFTFRKNGDIAGVTCECFTKENIEAVSAYDLLEEWNMTQHPDVWEKIIELSSNYGADSEIVRKQMDLQCLVDYIITNRDRHENNIIFLRDIETMRIFDIAPIFDSGSSEQLEGVLPEGVLDTKVNGLYATELECLQHVQDFSVLDVSKLPSITEIQAILNKCKAITPQRKATLIQLYEKKIAFIKELQAEYVKGTNMPEFINQKICEKKQEITEFFDIIK